MTDCCSIFTRSSFDQSMNWTCGLSDCSQSTSWSQITGRFGGESGGMQETSRESRSLPRHANGRKNTYSHITCPAENTPDDMREGEGKPEAVDDAESRSPGLGYRSQCVFSGVKKKSGRMWCARRMHCLFLAVDSARDFDAG